ncbi:MAG: hypothetical protein Q9183_001287, partial [Haloplaca sp. 2 TL-2023]
MCYYIDPGKDRKPAEFIPPERVPVRRMVKAGVSARPRTDEPLRGPELPPCLVESKRQEQPEKDKQRKNAIPKQ